MALDTAKAIAVARGLTAKWDEVLPTLKPVMPIIAMEKNSTGRDEQYGFLGGIPGFREWTGDRIFNQLNAATQVVENKKYENSIIIEEDDIEDDRVGLYGDVVGGMAEEAVNHLDELTVAELEAGGSTPVYDGQYFYDTDHSWGSSGTQSNAITSTAAVPATPTSAEFKLGVEAGIAKLLSFKNDKGKQFNRGIVGRLDGIVVCFPLNMRTAAHTAYEAAILANSSNVIVDMPRLLCLPGLTTTTDIHVLDCSGRIKPIVFQNRRKLRRQVKGPQMGDIEFKETKFMCDWRGRVRAVAWMKACRVRLTAP